LVATSVATTAELAARAFQTMLPMRQLSHTRGSGRRVAGAMLAGVNDRGALRR
jgi:hypothetical protein